MEKRDMALMNEAERHERLASLKTMKQRLDAGDITPAASLGYVNNHIHTTYSFSPYSPTRALWEAKMAGLDTAGIVDHDSIGGAREFIEAGKILDMAITVGIECRVSMKGTPFEKRRLNNTDQLGIAYMAIHGIPHQKIDDVAVFIKPYRDKRHLRNRKMVQRINGLFGEGFMDYDRDVMPLSMARDEGSITERHLMFALGKKMIERCGKGEALRNYLEATWQIKLTEGIRNRLLDEANPYYEYDLLGVLKGNFVKHIYVEADEECPDVKTLVAFADSIGAIPAYAYLGDVKNSITGDKADMKFEDDYIEALIGYAKEIGFKAVTYMPSRNTPQQLNVLRGLCGQHQLFQISGEDINSPRQAFTCEALLKPEFENLVVATWAMIGHEQEATKDLKGGMFKERAQEKWPALEERIPHFAEIGRK